MNWISVKERIPEIFKKVLVYSPSELEDAENITVDFCYKNAEQEIVFDYAYKSPTHWMPLPEPPVKQTINHDQRKRVLLGERIYIRSMVGYVLDGIAMVSMWGKLDFSKL